MAVRPQKASDVAPAELAPAQAFEPDVARAAAGDAEAFERVYRSHVARVHSLCIRMLGDRAEAEEATQDVFVRLWDKMQLYRGESAFSTWLHRLAVNVVLSRRKSDGTQRDRFTNGDVLELVAQRAAPAGIGMDLESAIAALPPGARRVFVLHDVEGFTHEEISGLLDITPGGSKAQLHRARMLLRKALDR